MSFVLRSVVLTLAAFGVATVLTSIFVALKWRTTEGIAARRADRLWQMRLLPLAVALAMGVFVVIGLWRFEARHDDEHFGWIIRISATVGAVFVVTMLVRMVQLYLETRSLLAAWLENAAPYACPNVPGLPKLTIPAYRIDTHFPVVAIVGIFRPILVVDRSVLDACSNEELAAILAHEKGHVDRWDNLRRALFTASPDLLAWTSIGPALRSAWRDATEEAADDAAAASSEEAGVHLADALIHVARIAQNCTTTASPAFPPTQLPASALYRGESIERRVRRLLAPAQTSAAAPRHWGAAFLALATVLAFTFQRELHDVMEVVVNGLW
jgi:Zn-dependent protease with chaperone function